MYRKERRSFLEFILHFLLTLRQSFKFDKCMMSVFSPTLDWHTFLIYGMENLTFGKGGRLHCSDFPEKNATRWSQQIMKRSFWERCRIIRIMFLHYCYKSKIFLASLWNILSNFGPALGKRRTYKLVPFKRCLNRFKCIKDLLAWFNLILSPP